MTPAHQDATADLRANIIAEIKCHIRHRAGWCEHIAEALIAGPLAPILADLDALRVRAETAEREAEAADSRWSDAMDALTEELRQSSIDKGRAESLEDALKEIVELRSAMKSEKFKVDRAALIASNALRGIGAGDMRTRIRAAEQLCDAAEARADALTADLARAREEVERLKPDAARFQALMRCGRIKMQGSAGVDPVTGARTYPLTPGRVHFGAEFWPQGPDEPNTRTRWGRHCLRALADDILALEDRAALANQGGGDGQG